MINLTLPSSHTTPRTCVVLGGFLNCRTVVTAKAPVKARPSAQPDHHSSPAAAGTEYVCAFQLRATPPSVPLISGTPPVAVMLLWVLQSICNLRGNRSLIKALALPIGLNALIQYYGRCRPHDFAIPLGLETAHVKRIAFPVLPLHLPPECTFGFWASVSIATLPS